MDCRVKPGNDVEFYDAVVTSQRGASVQFLRNTCGNLLLFGNVKNMKRGEGRRHELQQGEAVARRRIVDPGLPPLPSSYRPTDSADRGGSEARWQGPLPAFA